MPPPLSLSLSLSSPVFHNPKLTRVLVKLRCSPKPQTCPKDLDRYESRLGVWATLGKTGSKQRE
jgi:hypothetical protein